MVLLVMRSIKKYGANQSTSLQPLPFFNPTDVFRNLSQKQRKTFEISEDEANENESSFQILEGNSYEYAFRIKTTVVVLMGLLPNQSVINQWEGLYLIFM
jgi:hypothetical protein